VPVTFLFVFVEKEGMRGYSCILSFQRVVEGLWLSNSLQRGIAHTCSGGLCIEKVACLFLAVLGHPKVPRLCICDRGGHLVLDEVSG